MSYKMWCIENGLRYKAKASFKHDMDDFKTDRKRVGGKRHNWKVDCQLTDEGNHWLKKAGYEPDDGEEPEDVEEWIDKIDEDSNVTPIKKGRKKPPKKPKL